MISPSGNEKRGIVYTFYSFKGGVGRSMALANAAALLAKWGHRVLVVDWDLEAPGLERFFSKVKPDLRQVRAATPGIVDLVQAKRDGTSLNWRDCVIPVEFPDSSSLSLLTAGRNGEDYTTRLHSLDFGELFGKHDLGAYIEGLRNEWIAEFDFVLVDSRTGVTDIGGICTVHLADILVLLFTTTESSADGARQILERARKAQERLPLDRGRLLALPVPSRDESRTEYERAVQWKKKFAELFEDCYRDWLPTGKTAQDAIELLRIPYVPFWSFGEELPVIVEGTADPSSLGRAYEVLARFLAARLDWAVALEGQTLAPPPRGVRREMDRSWLEKHRRAALEGLAAAGKTGFMEIWHFCPEVPISRDQHELLAAATQAQVRTLGWPIGVVLNDHSHRPKATNDGTFEAVSGIGTFDYWALGKGGDYYAVASLQEDYDASAYLNTGVKTSVRICRAAEALLHCASLYRLLGADAGSQVEMGVRYGGLRGRVLRGRGAVIQPVESPSVEDQVDIPAITYRLGAVETDIVELVKKLCEPLFVVFDFTIVSDRVYGRIVTDFVHGRVPGRN